MQYSFLGSSGLVVSKLGFGAMTFAAEGGVPFAALGRKDAEIVMGRLIESGVTLLDTANVYSNSQNETILGELMGAARREMIVVTKAGARTGLSPNDAGLSARHLHLNVDESLKRLKTDWIDVFLCHLPDTRTPLEETLLALDQIVRAGKARYIGFSNWPSWLAAKAVAMQKANNLARFVTGQYQYNLLEREIEVDIIPACVDAGVGMMAYSPLASGLLSGKYSESDPTGGGGRLSIIQLPSTIDHQMAVNAMGAVIKIANERDIPPAAVALAWVAGQSGLSTVLMGVNKPTQLESNLKAADLILTSKENELLSATTKPPVRYPRTLLQMLGDDWTDPRVRDKAPRPTAQGPWRPE
jgi:aryl-alcohol dehydrogenase-like predicted oxidoreductase